MIELKIGQEVELEYGGTAKVLGVIGQGGQGIVYRVEFNGTQWALKWYDVSKSSENQHEQKNLKGFSGNVLFSKN